MEREAVAMESDAAASPPLLELLELPDELLLLPARSLLARDLVPDVLHLQQVCTVLRILLSPVSQEAAARRRVARTLGVPFVQFASKRRRKVRGSAAEALGKLGEDAAGRDNDDLMDRLDNALARVITPKARQPNIDIEKLVPVRAIGMGGQGGVWLAKDAELREALDEARAALAAEKAALASEKAARAPGGEGG